MLCLHCLSDSVVGDNQMNANKSVDRFKWNALYNTRHVVGDGHDATVVQISNDSDLI